MNLTPQPPPDPSPYGPGQCIDCGVAVSVPIIRCSRCAVKLSAKDSRSEALKNILPGGPPLERIHFAYSLRELFGVMTLVAVILAAFITAPLLGVTLTIVVIPAATRLHRLLHDDIAIGTKIPSRVKTALFLSTVCTNFFISVTIIAFAWILLSIFSLSTSILSLPIYSGSYFKSKGLVAGAVLQTIIVICTIALFFFGIRYSLKFLSWFSGKMNKYIAWRWQRDLDSIAFLARHQADFSSKRSIEHSSPFDDPSERNQTKNNETPSQN